MKKIALFVILLITIVGVYVWFFVYNKSHKDYQTADTAYIGTAIEFRQLATEDNAVFLENYRNEAIEISGSITEISTSLITLNENVFCKMAVENLNSKFEIGQVIQLKGRFVGIDEDILTGEMIFNLDQCVLK